MSETTARTLAEIVAALRIALEREAGCKCRALYCRHTSAAIDAAWAVVAAVRGEGVHGG